MSSKARPARGIPVLVAVGILAFWAGVYGFANGSDRDYWWHLAVGRATATLGHVPTTDAWSFTLPNHPWVAASWGSERIMYALHAGGGATGALVAFATVFASIFALLAADAWRLGVSRARALAMLIPALAALAPFAIPRPTTLAMLAFAAVLLLVEGFVERGGRARLAAIVAVLGVWANLHGSWVLGFGLLANVVGGGIATRLVRGRYDEGLGPRALGELCATGALGFAATFANPAGAVLHRYVLGKANQPMRQYLIEWQALDATTAVGMAFLATVFVAACAVTARGGFARIHHATLALGAAYAGLGCVRYVAFSAIALAAIAARTWPAEDGAVLARLRALRAAAPRVPWEALGALSVPLALAYPPVVGGAPYVERFDPKVPYEAVAALGDALLEHRTLNEYDWGSYLVWRYGDGRSVFVDGRADHFIAAGVFGDYMAAWRAGPKVDQVLDKHRVEAVLLRPSTPLLQYVLATGRCKVAYSDPQAVFASCRTP